MRIKKVSQVAGLVGGVSNTYSESTNDAYSCDYVNETFGGTVLYDNSTGGTFPVTISDNYANYSKIEVYFGYYENGFAYGFKKFTFIPSISTDANDTIVISGGGWFSQYYCRARFGGTGGKSLTMPGITQLIAANGSFSTIAVQPSTNPIRVVKVIGYK